MLEQDRNLAVLLAEHVVEEVPRLRSERRLQGARLPLGEHLGIFDAGVERAELDQRFEEATNRVLAAGASRTRAAASAIPEADELSVRRSLRERCVRRTVPERVREARRELVPAERDRRVAAFFSGSELDPIQKTRGLEHAAHEQLDPVAVVGAGAVVEQCEVALDVRGLGERCPVGTRAEADHEVPGAVSGFSVFRAGRERVERVPRDGPCRQSLGGALIVLELDLADVALTRADRQCMRTAREHGIELRRATE